MWEVFRDLFTTLLALVLVLVLAWWVLRWLNRRMPGLGGGSTERLIKVLDRVTVGKNTVLVLVRVKDTVMLVAVGDHAVEKLAQYDAADGAFDVEAVAKAAPGFADALRDTLAKSRFGGVLNKTGGSAPPADEGSDEGSTEEAENPAGPAPLAGGQNNSAAGDTGRGREGEDERHAE